MISPKPWPAPKLRAKDPRIEPDVFSEPFMPADVERIVAATGRSLKGRSKEELRRSLNASVIYWAALARAETASPSRDRANTQRVKFIWGRLAQIFRIGFDERPTAYVTVRATLLKGRPERVDTPFVRFVVQTLATLGYTATGDQIRDMARETVNRNRPRHVRTQKRPF